jgi:(p)ppGpp synthase/HD superfamily hydrolase
MDAKFRLFEMSLIELPLYSRALKFADYIHRHQTRKYSGEKYLVHPLAVSFILNQWGYNKWYQSIALLHDTVEDAENIPKTIEFIKKYFGDKILKVIKLLSHDKSMDYSKYLLQLAKKDKDAFIIKMADMWNNLNDNPSEKQKLKYSFAIKYLLDNNVKNIPTNIINMTKPYFNRVTEIKKRIIENRRIK